MTWDHERSFHYWNRRQFAEGRKADAIPGLAGWDEGVRLRAEAHRRMANDSRLDSDMRKTARRFAKRMFDHINGKCRGERYCDLCEHRKDFERWCLSKGLE